MLEGKEVVLGITGSIAAYKGADIASKLSQAGAAVNTVLTESATRFISPLTFESITGKKSACRSLGEYAWNNTYHYGRKRRYRAHSPSNC